MAFTNEHLAPQGGEALLDLMALVRTASRVDAAQRERVASELLTCLLALCQADRGAVLLREDHSGGLQSGHTTPETGRERRFRALALQQIYEEEAEALLEEGASPGEPIHSPDGTRWAVYRVSLDEGPGGDVTHRLEQRPGAFTSEVRPATSAWLLMGWREEPGMGDSCDAMLARCSQQLSLVTGPVETILNCLVLTERVEELEREATRAALDGMDLFKAELLGTVSHELRSPLASIKGYATTLLRHEHRLGREERHQFLLAITKASNRLEVIVEHLLEVSQFETDQVALARSPVDLARLAAEAIAVVAERMTVSQPGQFTFSLRLEQADGKPARRVPLILADQRRLRETLDNLLENACKYSPEGGPVTVTIRPVVQESPLAEAGDVSRVGEERAPGGAPVLRPMLELCVADSGQGIPAEHLERIFERFHRVDSSLVRETGGLGLGLTICKDIVELHGGSIWAENRSSGKGSAFFVRLPLEATDVTLP